MKSISIKITKIITYISLISIMIAILSGCSVKLANSDSTESGYTDAFDSTREYDPNAAIADRDCNLKNYPAEGVDADNLYQLNIPELSDADSINALFSYQGDLIALCEDNFDCTLYRIAPLENKILAVGEVPPGTYWKDAIREDDNGRISIVDYNKSLIYFFNGNLVQTGMVSFGRLEGYGEAFSVDMKHAYYFENGDVRVMNLDDNSSKTIFKDVASADNCYGVEAVLGDNESLVFYYCDDESDTMIYEIRNISTGESIYREENVIYGVQSLGDKYIVRHYEDGIDEIVYGAVDSSPKVLVLDDCAEYQNISASLVNDCVISSINKVNEESETITYNINVYNLSTGQKKYKSQFGFSYDSDEDSMMYSEICMPTYINNIGCVAFTATGMDNCIYIWDLNEDSSLSNDSECYIRSWQNPEQPDEESLKQLRSRADEIGDNYGIEIFLGDEIDNCDSNEYGYKTCTNAIRLEWALDMLDEELAKYPQGMFGQFEDVYDGPLEIYLSSGIYGTEDNVLSAAGGIHAVVDGVSFMVMDICDIYNLEHTIHHELCHAIENYLMLNEVYFEHDEWAVYNPEGFDYDWDYIANQDSYDFEYVYGDDENGVYFVDTYSKSFPSEDRARIMENVMVDSDNLPGLFDSEAIRGKLEYMSQMIRKGFDTDGWPETTIWEQMLIANP